MIVRSLAFKQGLCQFLKTIENNNKNDLRPIKSMKNYFSTIIKGIETASKKTTL